MSTTSAGGRIPAKTPQGAARRKILQLLIDTSESMENSIGTVNRQLHSWLNQMAKSSRMN